MPTTRLGAKGGRIYNLSDNEKLQYIKKIKKHLIVIIVGIYSYE